MICFPFFSFFPPLLLASENSHLLTIQPDLTSTSTSYQGTLRSRHDTVGKFSMTNGPLLDPLPNGSHTLHNGKLSADPGEFVSRLTAQGYFKTLPRDVDNTSYGTFNFLGGRLTLPNTGRVLLTQVVLFVLWFMAVRDWVFCCFLKGAVGMT